MQNKNRKILRAIPKQIIDQINAKFMWDKGFTGKNVNVAIFDTGLEKDHPHFKYVIERIDWTDEKNADDKIGHGTFVCGLIARYVLILYRKIVFIQLVLIYLVTKNVLESLPTHRSIYLKFSQIIKSVIRLGF